MNVYSRSAWGALQPRCVDYRALSDIHFVVGHYSDTHESIPSPTDVHDILVVQAIQRYHIETRGFCDIAYGCLIGGNGDIYQGRPANVVEAATLGHNHEEFSICLLTDGPITPAQENSFRFLMILADLKFPNLETRHPQPHRNLSATACPGDTITSWLATVPVPPGSP